tara:strand:+ start:336 stop:782 length:447 start_codon:yes stop_codon:yes gene_type:complete
MAARKGRKKTQRRRSKPKVNLLNAAQTALVANVLTKGLFNANLQEFITGTVNGQFRPGSDGTSVLTIPELAGFTAGGWSASKVGGSYAQGSNALTVMASNAGKNLTPLLVGVVGIPIAFKVAKQLTAKPLINPMNRGLKMVGLTGVKF